MSELTQLRRQIDQEIHAMHQGMTGYAVVSRHEVIGNYYQQLSDRLKELSEHIGEQAAVKVLFGTLEETDEPGAKLAEP